MQPGHLLGITKRHAPTLLDLAHEEAHEVIEHARDLSLALVNLDMFQEGDKSSLWLRMRRQHVR